MKKKVEMEQRLFTSNKKENISKLLHKLLLEKKVFCMYAHPNSNEIDLAVQEKNKQKTSFLIHPFKSTNNGVSFNSMYTEKDIENIRFQDLTSFKTKSGHPEYCASELEYKNYVQEIINNCKSGKIEKCVAARQKKVKLPENFSIVNFYFNLLENYPNAFVHISNSQEGLWIGATPELLLEEVESNIYQTTSLAGTKKKSEHRKWTAKEIEEQAIVTDYIIHTLENNNCKIIEKTAPFTQNAGNIEHIKTNITFQSKLSFVELAKILHPTPAVCGLPVEYSKKIIQQKEKNRAFYSGFIGAIESSKKAYVNLRCMKVEDEYAILHVGAGITKDSEPKLEWEETENKSKTLINQFN